MMTRPQLFPLGTVRRWRSSTCPAWRDRRCKGAGLVTERREANRIYYSLVEERLAVAVGNFLSTVCPEQIVMRRKRHRAARGGAV